MDPAEPNEKGARVRFPPPLVFLAGILLGIAGQRFVAAAPVPVARMVGGLGGLLLLAAGLGLIAWAQRHFTRTGQNPAPWKPSPELLLQGPYRFTRNPMYLGMTLISIGLGLATDNLWIVLFALLALLTVHLIAVLPEERYLGERFGERYQAYRAQVRRYL
jgi:protein-S-isoprenylcysteine O-methyltransferase Ste14